jgi:DNA replication protein DnaC
MALLRADGIITPLAPLLAAVRADAPEPISFDSHVLDSPNYVDELLAFYRRAVPDAWHEESVRSSAAILRYSLAHLIRGTDPLPTRLERCLSPGGAYFVAGLGRGFWSAVVQSLSPRALPRWLPSVEAGARRCGLIATRTPVGSVAAFAELCDAYQKHSPKLPAWQLDDLLIRVSMMSGRELPPHGVETNPIAKALREVRTAYPLRQRLKDNVATPLSPLAWQGLRRLDDAFAEGLPGDDEAAMMAEAVAQLRERHRVHSLEVNDLLERLAATGSRDNLSRSFRGFCSDSFAFLRKLAGHNHRDWMEANRDRYQFAVREPMVELCDALAERYVWPILHGEHGWQIECEPRTGKALTSIVKNDYGQTCPYVPEMWLTFYPVAGKTRQAAAQLFVRLTADGLRFGFHLGRTARDAGRRLRGAIQDHGQLLFDALARATEATRFGDSLLKSADDLRTWAAQKTLTACQHLPADAAILRSDDLVGEVLLAFDRLLPLFAAAVEDDATAILNRRAGRQAGTVFDAAAFERETFLPAVWLDRTRGLLKSKKQLILRGVSGTGKTHVAKCLARLLTRDRPDAVRFVQFHPAYTYEEFVERPLGDTFRDGVLLSAAGDAARHPAETFVLVIDELTRANLPRVFGELLYLLEYRGEAVTLPYSKRTFRLPGNLLLLATANPTDPAADTLDQPLRRRFAFVDMPPDAALLARWFAANPPADPDPTFGPRVLKLFEQLNARLAREGGREWQVGHSPFMVPHLDREKLATLWKHHVTPLVDARRGSADLLASFDLDRFFAPSQPV